MVTAISVEITDRGVQTLVVRGHFAALAKPGYHQEGADSQRFRNVPEASPVVWASASPVGGSSLLLPASRST